MPGRTAGSRVVPRVLSGVRPGRRGRARPRVLARTLVARSLLALAVVAPLGAAGVVGRPVPAQAKPEESPDAAASAPESTPADRTTAAPATVTLITGDRVTVREVADGRTTAVVDPAPRPNGVVPQFYVSTRNDQTSVVPGDLAPLLPDVLDPALFNVTSLVEQGYHDAVSPSLPVIVSYPEDRARTLGRRDLPAAEETRVLESVTAVAADVDKAEVADLATAVFRLAGAVAGQGTGRRRDPATLSTRTAGPLAGVDKIWLDGRVEAALDRSTAQISAPAAWAAGLTGEGVTVAVLDTGIDESHPDLAGAVTASHNFTDDPGTDDRYGHGTHVASIIAGTGQASGGDRRGVAEGAELVNGKVLGSDGRGALSWIIEGMEWAAGAADADIVNMSLGANPRQFGSALVTEAVGVLTAEHDALFVAAAGNNYCDVCIDSPGDAPSALTVGAVNREDGLADFSSRGPTLDGALKPDITAPGVGIAAARAEGTEGEGPYIEHSGTSMATPHVAGAAALLAQARPGLTPQELKGALMSTAVPTAGLTAYEQGAGRVDVGRLLDSPVLAVTGSADFGAVTKHAGGTDPVHESVTYHNASKEPVTLRLTTEGDVDGVAVERDTLTVPPGETAAVRVRLDLDATGLGRHSGRLVAEPPSGPALHTPIGFVVEPELFDLRLRGIARDGQPALPWVGAAGRSPVVDVDTGKAMTGYCPGPFPPGEICLQVPSGTYSVLAFIETVPAGLEEARFPVAPLHTTLVGDPEIEIARDTTLTLDARDATEVTVDTPAHPQARANLGGAAELGWRRTAGNGTVAADFVLNGPGAQAEQRLFMQPMDGVSTGSFAASSRWRLEAPAITLSLPGDDQGTGDVELDPYYYRMSWFSDFSAQFPRLEGSAELRVVNAGLGRQADLEGLDLAGALALIRRGDDIPVAEQSNAAAEAGARMVAIYNDRPGVNGDPGGVSGPFLEVPTVRLSHEAGRRLLDRLANGPVTVRAEGTTASPYAYDLVYDERGRVAGDLRHTAKPKELVRVERDFHSQVTDDISYSEASYALQPSEPFAMTFLRPLTGAPRTRVDYHVSDPRTRWSYGVTTPERPHNYLSPHPETARLGLASGWVTYEPGERASQSWLRQPVAPGLNQRFPVVRRGDALVLGKPFPSTFQAVGLVDSALHFSDAYTETSGKGLNTRFDVRRGDEVLWETEYVPGGLTGLVELPTGDEETYRMAFEVANHASWARLSTRTRTEWTFRSSRTEPAEPKPVPLLTLAYDLGVDLRNRAEAPPDRNGPNRVEVTVDHQAGLEIPVRGLTFAVSYDDGKTWREVPEHRRGGGRYVVHLRGRAPRDAEFVSFRVGAKDAEGNRISQEIIRATALPRFPRR